MIYIQLSVNNENAFALYGVHNTTPQPVHPPKKEKACLYDVYEFDAVTGERKMPKLGSVSHKRSKGGEALAAKALDLVRIKPRPPRD